MWFLNNVLPYWVAFFIIWRLVIAFMNGGDE